MDRLGLVRVCVVLLLALHFFRRRGLAWVTLAVQLANARHPLVLVLDFSRINDQIKHVHDHLRGIHGNLAQQLHHLFYRGLGVGFAVITLANDVVSLVAGNVVEHRAVFLRIVDRHPLDWLAFAHDANDLLLGHKLLDVTQAQASGQLLCQSQVVRQFARCE